MTIDKAFRALIRYPVDPHNKEPTTQPVVFKAIGKRDKLYWSRALKQVTEYLENHPDDGFSY